MNTSIFVLGIAIFTVVFVVLQKRRNELLSGYRLSQFWCLAWGLIGVVGIAFALLNYWRTGTTRAVVGDQPDDVQLTVLSTMNHISFV